MRPLWNDAQLARLTALRANSHENAALPRGKARYSVILFSPGGGLKALTYDALLEDLASRGWVVVALDLPYNPRAMRLPDGRVLGNLQPNERGWPPTRNPEEDQHIDFSDEPCRDRAGRLQTIADTRIRVRAFFDSAARGDWTSLKRLTKEALPQIMVHIFGKLWP